MDEVSSIKNKQWQSLELKDPLFSHQKLSNKCVVHFVFTAFFHGINQLTCYCCLGGKRLVEIKENFSVLFLITGFKNSIKMF